MPETPLNEDEQRAVDRLRRLGGTTNIASFPDLDVVKRLIARRIFREVGMFGVAFASPAPAVQKTNNMEGPPTEPAVPRGHADEPRTGSGNPDALQTGRPSVRSQARPKRQYRKHISRPDLQGRPILLWMWRWANALREFGGRAYLRELRRRINAHKDKTNSSAGLARLISFRCVRRSKDGRRPVLELVRYPNELDPPKPKAKRRHPRRSRGRTDWFERLLDYRDKTD